MLLDVLNMLNLHVSVTLMLISIHNVLPNTANAAVGDIVCRVRVIYMYM